MSPAVIVEHPVDHGEVVLVGAGPEVAGLTCDRFELLRCLGGRRSERQVRTVPWEGAVDAVLPHLSPYPLPAHDLLDP